MAITHIKKRNGSIVKFEEEKIVEAIFKAAQSVGGTDKSTATKIAAQVVSLLELFFKNHKDLPSVEQIQDLTEKILIENGHAKTAKAFILYRNKHKEIREEKVNNLSKHLHQYLISKDSSKESPGDLFNRVATFASKSNPADKKVFTELLNNLDFVPSNTILLHAGNKNKNLENSYAIRVEDNIESIFESLKKAVVINQSGATIGVDFSLLRPRGNLISEGRGEASGPVSFLKAFDSALKAIKANLAFKKNAAILDISHPDILEFISLKDGNRIENFSLIVKINQKFINAVEKNSEYELINPRDNTVVNKLHAQSVLDLISLNAWQDGEPRITFLENTDIPTDSTSAVLAEHGSKILSGTINLGNIVLDKKIDNTRLEEMIKTSINFLSGVADQVKNNQIAIGIMGFAEMLIQMKISYNSLEAILMAEKVIQKITEISNKFENVSIFISYSDFASIVAECSPGIEPIQNLVSTKMALDGSETLSVNPLFEKALQEENIFSQDLIRQIGRANSLQKILGISPEIKKIFLTGGDIEPSWHLRIQSVFQKYLKTAVTKNIVFPLNTTTDVLTQTYLLAYRLGCKTICIFKDSRIKELRINENETPENQISLPFETEQKKSATGIKKAQEPKAEKKQKPPIIAQPPKFSAQEVFLPPIENPKK